MADRTFADQLVAAGLLRPTGVAGIPGKSGALEDLILAVDRQVTLLAADQDAVVMRFPPLFPRAVFEQTGYLASFPDLVGAIDTFAGGDPEHARLLGVFESGEDWAGELTPTDLMLVPSVCHPVYPQFRGRLTGETRVDVMGYVFRHEPSDDPRRMQCFRQHDIVYLGTADGAVEHRDMWVDRCEGFLVSLGLPIHREIANDPFFGRAGRLLARSQRAAALKIELLVDNGAPEPPTSVGSGNCHGDHFGKPFGIEWTDGTTAHTACFGFGLERISLSLLRVHGLDIDRWPDAVRQRLDLGDPLPAAG